MTGKPLRCVTILTVLLAVSLAAVSICGAFVPGTYSRDAASLAAQGIGQDLVNLFLVVPLLAGSLAFIRRGSRAALLIYAGTVFYILYSFVIYALGVHFNRLFLAYCLTLGLSFYAFILIMIEMAKMDVENWYGPGLPVRLTGFYLVVVSALFYLLWLKDVLPAVINNTVPRSVSDYQLLVNPVHVMDMAIALPGLVIAALLLMRRRRLGYILAPAALVFTVVLAIALAGMVVMSKAKGVSEDISIAAIFIVLAVISGIFLETFLKRLKNRNPGIISG
jgi:hypothetical protein